MAEAGAPRRVLIVTATARRRGAEIQAGQLAVELRRIGHHVDIRALSRGTDGQPLPVDVLGRRRLGPTTLWNLRRAARSADVVIAYGSTTLPASMIALAGSKIPLIYRSISDPDRWLRGRAHRWVTALQYRRPTRIVALWPAAADSITAQFGVPDPRISVIPNARNPDQFSPPSAEQRRKARRALGLDGHRTVAFLGSLTPEKRVDVAIETIAHLPEHQLVVAGDGPLRAMAEALAERIAPGRVTFLGELADVEPLLHGVDAVVITSDIEGMPGIAIEAALCGTPVVATDVGSLSTLPFVTSCARDPALIAAAVADAPSPDPGTVTTYTWPAVTEQWSTVLEEVTTGSSGPRSRSSIARRLTRSSRAVAQDRLLSWRPTMGVVTRVETTEPIYALTFDDGPDDGATTQLLDVLAGHGARATFFVLGQRVAGRERVIDQARLADHCIGTHGWDHRSLVMDLAAGTPGWAKAQVERGARALPARPTVFRAPSGHLDRRSRRAVAECGLDAIGWDVDPRDYRGEGAAALAGHVLDRVRPGSIVLLHDGLQQASDVAFFDRTSTVEAVRLILAGLEGQMRCVTVPELMAAGRARRTWPRHPATWTAPNIDRSDAAATAVPGS